jgi:hypothetical protein
MSRPRMAAQGYLLAIGNFKVPYYKRRPGGHTKHFEEVTVHVADKHLPRSKYSPALCRKKGNR